MKIFLQIIVLIFCEYCALGIPAVNNEIVKSHQWMNEAVDPCEDFLNFTCGGYSSSIEIPEGQDPITIFGEPHASLANQIKSMLEEPIKDEDLKALNNAKMYYKACMNTEKIDKSSLNDMKDVIKQLGGWPVVDSNWIELDYKWEKVVYKMTDLGLNVDAFIDVDVVFDHDDEGKDIYKIDLQRMSFGPPFIKNGKNHSQVQKYLKYMTDVAIIFGADDNDNTKKDMEDTLDIEIKLAEASLVLNEDSDPLPVYNYTIKELQIEFPNVPWLEYLTKVLMDTATLQNSENVTLKELGYFKMLNTILAETPKRILANFQIWHAIRPLIFTLNQNIRDIQSEYFGEGPLNKKVTRSSFCTEQIKERLPILLSSMYVRKYADPKSRELVTEMANLLIKEFRKSLEANEWLPEDAKSVAIQKSRTINKTISYNDELLDDKKISEKYKDLHLEEDNFLYVNINNSRFNNYMEYRKLKEPIDHSDYIEFENAADITGNYDSERHSLVCAAGLIHHEKNFFNKAQPMYMNFGRLGAQLALEMTKDFFSLGRYSDADGKSINWWSNETEEAYDGKAKCIQDQFEQYTKDIKAENYTGKYHYDYYSSAAISGYQQAYRAYKTWLIKHNITADTETEYRPNRAYSHEQFFWINTAQLFCFKSNRPHRNLLINFDFLAKFGNLEEFSKDWKCSSGSRMNLAPKCKIW